MSLANIHFIYPEWLLVLIPLVILWWFFSTRVNSNNAWSSVIDKHLLVQLSGSSRNVKNIKYLNTLVAIVLIATVIALSGPSFFKEKSPLYQLDKLQVILLDASPSTYTKDIKPSRFARSVLLIKQLLKQNKDGEIMVIAFSSEPYILSPPTSDAKPILNLLDGLNQSILPTSGSNLSLALKYTIEVLADYKNKSIDILLLTDEDNVTSASLDAAKELNSLDYKLSVLSVASAKKVPISTKDGLLKDKSGKVIIAKVNQRLLTLLANNGGGIYQKLTNDNLNIKNYLDFTKKHLASSNIQDNKQSEVWLNSGIYIVYLLLFLTILLFRGGYLLAIMVFVVIFDIPPSYAADYDFDNLGQNDLIQNIWQTRDTKAKEHYDNKEYNKAAQLFTNKSWLANATYKAGDYKAAANMFKDLGEKYNYGNALAQQEQYQEAMIAYEEVSDNNINYKNAQENMGLMQKIIKQQKKQQQKSQDGDKKDQKDDKKEQQDNKQGDKDKQDKDNKNQQQKDNKQGDKDNKDKKNNPDEKDKKDGDKKDKEQDDKDKKSAKDKKNEQDAKDKKDEQDKKQKAESLDKKINSQIKKQRLEQVFKRIQTKPVDLLRTKFTIERQKRLNEKSQFINK